MKIMKKKVYCSRTKDYISIFIRNVSSRVTLLFKI